MGGGGWTGDEGGSGSVPNPTARGKILRSNATPVWEEHGGSANQYLAHNGTDAIFRAILAGDLPASVLLNTQDNALGQHFYSQQTINIPATPAAGYINKFVANYYGREVDAYVDSLGRVTYVTDYDVGVTFRPWYLGGGGASASGFSSNLPVSVTNLGTIANKTDSSGGRKNASTGAVINTDAGVRSTTTMCTRANNPRFGVVFQPLQTANWRQYIGLYSATPMTASANPTISQVGLRLASDAGNANYCLVVCDGTTENVIQLLAADAQRHRIWIEIDNAAGKVYYSLDGATIASTSANLPAASTQLSLYLAGRNLAASDMNFDLWLLKGGDYM